MIAADGGGDPEVDVLDTWIPLPDGCRLAARLWLPRDAHVAPVPTILEYLPYRKRDGTAQRDSGTHPFFAAHGYASLRVDIRGTGDSEGTFDDEYSPQEHADALAIMDWIVQQPWSDGVLGMMGISWGGFNSLQVAALRPAALKAIVTVCSTDDRYNDDCHYQGGTVIGDDMLPWAASLLAIVATPPHASSLDDEAMLDRWKSRIDSIEPPAHLWLAHQLRDDYWKHGSVCQDYSAIDAATLIVGGWADGYSNAALRLVENLTCERRAIIGPWAHMYPHLGRPGPTLDFLQECLRWWDYWLRGQQSGAMDTPLLRTWINDWHDPSQDRTVAAGRWVGLESWEDSPSQTLYPGSSHLGAEVPGEGEIVLASAQDSGFASGAWCAYGPGDLPSDQRSQDSRWSTFDTKPLEEPLEVFGCPNFEALVASDQPEANICLRLCDVAPDGTSLLVSEGVLNLSHRLGHESPVPLTPGEPVPVTVRLDALGHKFAAGHRVRLTLSSTYFPRAWPSPKTAVLTLHAGPKSLLRLPVLPVHAVPVTADPAPEPVVGVPSDRLLEPNHGRELSHSDSASRLTVTSDSGLVLIDSDTLHGSSARDIFSIESDDPLSAEVECLRTYTVGTEKRPAMVRIATRLSCDEGAFYVETRIEAFLCGDRVHERHLSKRIARAGHSHGEPGAVERRGRPPAGPTGTAAR